MTKEKIALFGHSGFLGKKILTTLNNDPTIEVITIGRAESSSHKCDLTDHKALKRILTSTSPSIIIQAAAWVDVAQCELDLTRCFQVNFLSNLPIIEYCSKNSAKLIFVSSDYVFGDSTTAQFETSSTFPLNNYGKAKSYTEELITKHLTNFYIIRPAILYGHNQNENPSEFIQTLLTKKRAGLDNRRLKYPVLIDDVAMHIQEIVNNSHEPGIFHLSSKKPITKLRMAEIICETFGLSCELTTENENSQNYKPDNVVLGDSKALNCKEFKDGVKVIYEQIKEDL